MVSKSMRTIKILKGKEINEEAIAKIREITKLRYAEPVYNSSYWGIEDLNTLAELHGVEPNNEILVLGEDWFLCYSYTENIVEFLEWVALNDIDNKFAQTLEMMRVLKNILIQNKEKKFTTSMRHNGSYPFYINMFKRGLFQELSHSYDIDICHGFAQERLKYLEDEYTCLSNFFNSEEAANHPEYLTFILHNIDFIVTDIFIERYAKTKKL